MRFSGMILLGLTIAVLAGCSRPPTLAPVRGKVLVNGQLLRGGTVVFAPDGGHGSHGPLSFAVIDDHGAYLLASDDGPGAVVGWHRVTVAPLPDFPDLISALERYRNPDLSGLRFEVKADRNNEIDILLVTDQ
jgi:hypothetical protein